VTSGLDEITGRFAGAGVEANVSLEVGLGRLVRHLDAEHARRRRLRACLTPIPLAAPGLIGLAAANGTINYPEGLSPHDGYVWDVRRITATGWTAGTVTASIGPQATSSAAPNTQNDLVTWAAPGTYFSPSGAVILQAHDRLEFTAATVTGNVLISGLVIQMEADLLADYLL